MSNFGSSLLLCLKDKRWHQRLLRLLFQIFRPKAQSWFSFWTEVDLSQWDLFCIPCNVSVEKTCFQQPSFSFSQVKAAEGERDAWEGFRASLRLLHPALVLPLSQDLLSLTPDLSSLPPPPPPAVEGEVGTTEGELDTDSPMMWKLIIV